jgi:hypothetical protein
VAQLQRLDDAFVDFLLPAVTGGLLDDHAGQYVVGVGVRPASLGPRVVGVRQPAGLARHGHRDLFLGGAHLEALLAIALGCQLGRVLEEDVGVVDKPAGVLEQVADGDAAAVVAVAGDHVGQPLVDGVVQAQLALGDQLEGDDGHEGLGVAADPVVGVVRHGPAPLQIGDA